MANCSKMVEERTCPPNNGREKLCARAPISLSARGLMYCIAREAHISGILGSPTGALMLCSACSNVSVVANHLLWRARRMVELKKMDVILVFHRSIKRTPFCCMAKKKKKGGVCPPPKFVTLLSPIYFLFKKNTISSCTSPAICAFLPRFVRVREIGTFTVYDCMSNKLLKFHNC